MIETTMSTRYLKSPAGHDEIRNKALSLTRPGRNLLLIIDATKTDEEWLQLVRGTTDADLQQLLDNGLLTAQAVKPASDRQAAGAASAQTAAAGSGVPPMALVFERMEYKELYELLTREARSRLGMLKSYRVILDVEKCANVEELRACALRFIEQVREAQGEGAARAFCLQLGGGAPR
jgi:hypothetical protein